MLFTGPDGLTGSITPTAARVCAPRRAPGLLMAKDLLAGAPRVLRSDPDLTLGGGQGPAHLRNARPVRGRSLGDRPSLGGIIPPLRASHSPTHVTHGHASNPHSRPRRRRRRVHPPGPRTPDAAPELCDSAHTPTPHPHSPPCARAPLCRRLLPAPPLGCGVQREPAGRTAHAGASSALAEGGSRAGWAAVSVRLSERRSCALSRVS